MTSREGWIRYSEGLEVTFCLCHGADPFICAVNGNCTIDNLDEIEKEVRENSYDDMKLDGRYKFRCAWYAGEYGEYGVCEIAPGWELELINFEPPQESNDDKS